MKRSTQPHICFLTSSFPDYQGSYRGIFVWRAAQKLMERGYRVKVVTPRLFKRSKRCEVFAGVPVYRFPFLSEEKLLIEYDKIPMARMVTYMCSALVACLLVARKNSSQMIHAHFVLPTGLIGAVVGRLLRIPVVIHAHGSDMTRYARLEPWLHWLTTLTTGAADHIIAVSDELSKILREEFQVPSEKITVRNCSVDTEYFRPLPRREARKQLGLPCHDTIALFVGSLSRWKGVDLLLSAFKRVKDHHASLKLYVVGDGPLQKELRARARRLGIEKTVHFVGHKENQQMPLWYNAADIFVLPSLREGTPVSLLEALSCGVPAVVSRAGGMPEIIKDGHNGLLSNTGDASDLGEKIAMLLGSEDLRQRFKKNGRQTILEKGRIQQEIDVVVDVYSNLGLLSAQAQDSLFDKQDMDVSNVL
ncbi:MAG: glycosyltransferase family 4 protein [Deltaproteobacteria bacterium]|nr:glycosyltransferase family 4 protein [Deltaproteobacteria bacterium]MBW2071189.1 glycosyltransferase family 4 protein [Deltaproteobacteria bacterium]